MKVHNKEYVSVTEVEKRIKKKETRLRTKQLKKNIKYQKIMEKIEIKNSKLPSTIFKWVFMAIIFVVLSTIITIGVLCMDCLDNSKKNTEIPMTNSFEEEAEAALLASGLSIIGIAISVWAGLNVIQVLEKNKLAELSKEVSKYREERYETNRDSFYEIVNNHKDELNLYIRKMFEGIEVPIKDRAEVSDLFFICLVVEKMFQMIYQQHFLKIRVTQANCETAIREIDNRLFKLESSEIFSKDIFINYFKLRKAEINFFLGYDVGKRESYRCFSEASEIFADVFSGIRDLENLKKDYLYLFKTDTFAAFMINTMGEIYSKMLHAQADEKGSKSNLFEENERMSEGYFKILEEILSNPNSSPEVQREIYYRNYACFLERRKDYSEIFTDKEYETQIKELHQKAMEIALSKDEPTKIQVRQIPSKYLFKAWLQFYHRKIQYVDLLGICTKENETHKNYVMENMKMLSEYAERAAFYAEIATSLYPNDIYNIKMWAFAERDLVLLSLLKGENAQSIYLKFAERIRKMKLLLVNADDYSRQLEAEFLKITTLLKDYKTDKRRNPRR